MANKVFIRPPGHEKCSTNTGIHDCLTFGRGKLDGNGFWSKPCVECARAYEQQFPEDGPCWPHTNQQLEQMGFLTENQRIFLDVVDQYQGIADNGNIMRETGWLRSKVIAVGRGLMKKGRLSYTRLDADGFEGGLWKLVEVLNE